MQIDKILEANTISKDTKEMLTRLVS